MVVEHIKKPMQPPAKQRVAAYARVSVATDMMAHSLEAQISYYKNKIAANLSWEFVGVYADYGISGTSTKLRTGFNKMITDCKNGLINMVLVKSISRFARNTVDCLTYVRHLKSLGIAVIFERENINTMTSDGELLLTLLASFAQEESRSISENVRWRVMKDFHNKKQNGYKAPYGYKWDGKHYVAIPEQAAIVREIYDRYLAGESAYAIAWSLADRGITGQTGAPMEQTTVKEILTSLSYTGDKELHKYYISDSHQKKRNKGVYERPILPEMYDPIVTKEEYDKACAIRQQRAKQYAISTSPASPLSGKVICGCCGRHCSLKSQSNGRIRKWVCNSKNRRSTDPCSMRPLHHEELLAALPTSYEYVTIFNDSFDISTKSATRKVFRQYDGYKRRTGFSGLLTCTLCGSILVRRTDKGRHYWACSCGLHRLPEATLRQAASFLGDHYEARFATEIVSARVSNTDIVFTTKMGDVSICQIS